MKDRINVTSSHRKLQLIILFGVGLVVVAVTITRLPLILNQSADLKIRSMRSRVCSYLDSI
jgi:hypothetical protein